MDIFDQPASYDPEDDNYHRAKKHLSNAIDQMHCALGILNELTDFDLKFLLAHKMNETIEEINKCKIDNIPKTKGT